MARSYPANEQRPSRASRATRELSSLFEDLEQPSADCLAEFPAEKEVPRTEWVQRLCTVLHLGANPHIN